MHACWASRTYFDSCERGPRYEFEGNTKKINVALCQIGFARTFTYDKSYDVQPTIGPGPPDHRCVAWWPATFLRASLHVCFFLPARKKIKASPWRREQIINQATLPINQPLTIRIPTQRNCNCNPTDNIPY